MASLLIAFYSGDTISNLGADVHYYSSPCLRLTIFLLPVYIHLASVALLSIPLFTGVWLTKISHKFLYHFDVKDSHKGLKGDLNITINCVSKKQLHNKN